MKTRKNLKKKIWMIFLLIVAVGVCVSIFQYFILKNKADKYLHTELELDLPEAVSLIGLLDSYGVPYSTEVKESFMDYLSGSLMQNNLLDSEIDMFNLYLNKTWDLDGLYKNDITFEEFVSLQNYSIDFVRHKYGKRIRDDLVYTCDSSVGDRTISELTSSADHPLVLYSCVANDLFYYFDLSLESLTLKKVADLTMNFDSGLALIERQVDSNFSTILSCNPDAQIFAMGLYVPSDNFFIQRAGMPIINMINRAIRKVCEQYENVYYVDVTCLSFAVLEGDFHPNADGQYMLASILAYSISENYKEVNNSPEADLISSDSKTETEKKENETRYSINLLEECIVNSGLPLDDYVECSVAIEWALDQLGWTDITYMSLEKIRLELPEEWNFADTLSDMDRALEIMIIERNVLYGISEKEYALDLMKNDKLSLIEYYEDK